MRNPHVQEFVSDDTKFKVRRECFTVHFFIHGNVVRSWTKNRIGKAKDLFREIKAMIKAQQYDEILKNETL